MTMLDLNMMMPAFTDEMQKLAKEDAEKAEKPKSGLGRQLLRIGAVGAGVAAGTAGVGLLHGALSQEPSVRRWYANMPPASRKRLWQVGGLGIGAGLLVGGALTDRLRAKEMDRMYGSQDDR